MVTGTAHAQFVSTYTDKINHLSWSKSGPLVYTNGCEDANYQFNQNKCTVEKLPHGGISVKIDDSNAALACNRIGARLPTKSEFESLIRNFEHTEESFGPRLSYRGRSEMQMVFKETDPTQPIWTSSVDPLNSRSAYVFNDGAFGNVERVESRVQNEYVRCVR